jgi:regulator of protease activity HflC (stomatin/prohibitin superfamily)
MGLFVALLVVAVGLVIFSRARTAEPPAAQAGVRLGGGILFALGAFLLLRQMVVVVPVGAVGVVSLFGRVNAAPLREGIHLINPLADVNRVSIRMQEYTMSAVGREGALEGDDAIQAISKDGLPLPIDVTVNYRPNPTSAPWLFRNVGREEDFVSKIIRPASRTAVREAVAGFTAQEAYSTKREALSTAIYARMEAVVESVLSKNENYTGNAFVIQQVLVRNIQLPEKLKSSIELKLTAEQDALRMKFVLEKETQEAERKRIEARGVADFQAIVSQGISQPFLEWKGIEATQELAKSPNTKIVVVGNSKNGLPIILGDGASK